MDSPDRITIRTATVADCDDLGLITVSASFSAFLGAIDERLLDLSWSPAASAARWREDFATLLREGVMLIAEQNGRAVGYGWGRPRADAPGYDGEIKGLYVLPTHHGRGIGRSLVRAVLEALIAMGVTALEIGCVRENPSCGFYRRLGGKPVGTRPVRVDDFETVEILFGWSDLSGLLGSGGARR